MKITEAEELILDYIDEISKERKTEMKNFKEKDSVGEYCIQTDGYSADYGKFILLDMAEKETVNINLLRSYVCAVFEMLINEGVER